MLCLKTALSNILLLFLVCASRNFRLLSHQTQLLRSGTRTFELQTSCALVPSTCLPTQPEQGLSHTWLSQLPLQPRRLLLQQVLLHEVLLITIRTSHSLRPRPLHRFLHCKRTTNLLPALKRLLRQIATLTICVPLFRSLLGPPYLRRRRRRTLPPLLTSLTLPLAGTILLIVLSLTMQASFSSPKHPHVHYNLRH